MSVRIGFLRQFGDTGYPFLWIRIPFRGLCSLDNYKNLQGELPGAMTNGLLETLQKMQEYFKILRYIRFLLPLIKPPRKVEAKNVMH